MDSGLASTIRSQYEQVREEIDHAAVRSGRDASAVRLVVVTKTHPLSIIQAALEAGIRDLGEKGGTLDELTAPHIARFMADLRELRIGPPDVLTRATEHIPEMAALIARLLENGHAYRTDDGSIFFRISSWPAYGKLARLEPGAARQTERVAADDYGKDDVRDFALWKGAKPGEPSWDTERRTKNRCSLW